MTFRTQCISVSGSHSPAISLLRCNVPPTYSAIAKTCLVGSHTSIIQLVLSTHAATCASRCICIHNTACLGSTFCAVSTCAFACLSHASASFSIAPLPECERQGNEISALAKVAEESVQETEGVEQGTWASGAIRRARYRRGERMTRKDTKVIFPVATKGPAAAQWTGHAVHILLPDDRVGDRGLMEVEVRHRQGARYQYDVLVPNVVVTTAAAEGTEVRIGLSREGQAVQMYTIGHWEEQLVIQWTTEPTWREPLHAEDDKGRGSLDGEDPGKLGRAEQEKEKRQKEAAAKGLDMLGDGRDRKDVLQGWAQRLRGKTSTWQNVLIENGEAPPGVEERIKGSRVEEVRQAVSKARYHMRARPEAVEDECRPECTLARCLCRLDGPQEPKGGYHGIRVRQPRRQGPMWLQMGEDDGAPLVYFHQVKHMWVGYADGWSGAVYSPCRLPPGTRNATCAPCVGAHGMYGWPCMPPLSSSAILMASAAISVISRTRAADRSKEWRRNKRQALMHRSLIEEYSNNARLIVLDGDEVDPIHPSLEFVLGLGTKFVPYPLVPSFISKSVGPSVNEFTDLKHRLY